VTEHVNPGQSWTDLWTIVPGSGQPPTALAQDVQVQGPFEISPDQQSLLFASPRNGNFDIYVASLDAAGQAALKTLSSQTELSPAVAAAAAQAQPTAVSTSSGGNARVGEPVAARSAGSSSTGTGVSVFPGTLSPYVVALVGLALIWAGVEGVMIARRRTRRRTPGSDGQ
jgi:hypothetical protein